ncbi:MAG TPA: hypothetical protein VKB69_06465 [Micromonosporaceae bacterium]|nr:hypothetical protein [Micromonosporaceae bacterium]
MAEPPVRQQQTFPRRDERGRVASWPEMVVGVVLNVVVGTIILAAIDGIIALLGSGTFGTFSGWIAGILAVWLFVEDFRAWKIGTGRIGVCLLGIVLGLGVGIVIARSLTILPNLFAGAVGVLVAALLYAAVWFFGIRALADRIGER